MSVLHALSETSRRPGATWVAVALVQLVVLYNVTHHDPEIGYDTNHHLEYVVALAQSRLPTPADTGEFFVPPLPYALPAAALGRGWTDLHGAARLGVLQNGFLSLGILVGLVRLCRHLRPQHPGYATLAVLFLGCMPVYHKTLCYLRGEPFLTLFGIWAAVFGLRVLGRSIETVRKRDVVGLGATLGLAILSRQWAFFFFPALGLLALVAQRADPEKLRRSVVVLTVATALAAGIGAWFYLSLKARYGSFTAYNNPNSPGFHLDNQSARFYFGTGDGRLFTDPVRDAFPNQLGPILYSEFWGDYWCYFQIYGRHRDTGRYILGIALDERLDRRKPPSWLETNRHEMGPRLGRVNAVSLLPSLLLAAGIALGGVSLLAVGRGRACVLAEAQALSFLVIAITGAGYFWFLVSFPDYGKGGTLKASYLMQTFPFLALLGADVVQGIASRRPLLARTLLAALAGVAVHNLPFLLTRIVPV